MVGKLVKDGTVPFFRCGMAALQSMKLLIDGTIPFSFHIPEPFQEL